MEGTGRATAGRYCLNDLHKAAGGADHHRPKDFLRLKQTEALVAELGGGNHPLSPVDVQRGYGGGTHVVKELVYAYAMWISPKFHIQVIRAYDSMVTAKQAAAVELKALVVQGHGALTGIPRARSF